MQTKKCICPITQEILYLLFTSSVKITIIWIFTHTGITGNKKSSESFLKIFFRKITINKSIGGCNEKR